MLQAIPDPELSITEADINLQLREALISTTAEMDPELDAALLKMETTGSDLDTGVEVVSQADYISFSGLDMDWNYLDADEDADTNLF